MSDQPTIQPTPEGIEFLQTCETELLASILGELCDPVH
jgi:hypothetical protein